MNPEIILHAGRIFPAIFPVVAPVQAFGMDPGVNRTGNKNKTIFFISASAIADCRCNFNHHTLKKMIYAYLKRAVHGCLVRAHVGRHGS